MTLRMYAERKGIALQSVEVRLSHGRIHAKDCEDCETEAGMLDEIHSEIHLEGDLDKAQRKRLNYHATNDKIRVLCGMRYADAYLAPGGA